jgi:integrase
MIAGHRIGHYSAQGKLLTPLSKKQIKAVEKTLPPPLRRLTDLSKPDISLATKSGHLHLLTTLKGSPQSDRDHPTWTSTLRNHILRRTCASDSETAGADAPSEC